MKEPFFDVVVAGGGPAGVFAAVAAARSGVTVLLVEREQGLGGNVRAAHVHSICGLYRITDGGAPSPVHGRLAGEFLDRLRARDGACGPQRFGKLDILLQEPEIFSRVCREWIADTPGIELCCASRITGAAMDNRAVRQVEIESAGGRRLVGAGAVVEATGDGNLAAAGGLGWSCAPRDLLQRPAFIFGMGPVSSEALQAGARLALSGLILRAVREGRLPEAALSAVVRPTCLADMLRVTLDLGAGGAAYDPCDERQVARLTEEARVLALELAEFLRKEAEGFAAAQIRTLPDRIGIRESRRVTGRTTVTAEDVLGGNVPEDAVCWSAWPVELHEAGGGMRLVYPRADAPCAVPLGALRSRDADNVFLAGRCLSATHEAQAALRVIGTSFGTGQAAGMGAACVAAGGEPDPKVIREACSP